MSTQFTILIDGQCSLCSREAAFMQRLDKGRGRLRLIDITDPAFDPASLGLTFEQVMGQIHGILPDGSVIRGMEVFRRAYAALGWGWVLAPTAWPGLRWLFDRFYLWFARNRHRFSRRVCSTDRCRV